MIVDGPIGAASDSALPFICSSLPGVLLEEASETPFSSRRLSSASFDAVLDEGGDRVWLRDPLTRTLRILGAGVIESKGA